MNREVLTEPVYLSLIQFCFMQYKKIFFLLILSFTTVALNAQFKKGDKMAGATVGSFVFNSGSSDITVAIIGSNKSISKSYNLTIAPLLGCFISDKTVAGATLTINPNGQKTAVEQNGSTYRSDKFNGFNIGAGGFVRNYFISNNNSLLPFGQVSLNTGINNQKTEGFFYGGSGTSAYKITYTGNSSGGFFMNAAFSAGFTKMMGENAGLDFYAGYNYSYNKSTFKKTTLRDDMINGTIDERGENETTIKTTNHGFILGVGFQFFLKGKK